MNNQAQSLETPACARSRIASHHNLATICVLMKGATIDALFDEDWG
jgi:hypothetical protein